MVSTASTAHRSFRRRSSIAVAIGGGIGSGIRYEIGLRWGSVDLAVFPWTTLTINLVGAFLLGVLMTLVLEHWPPTRYVRPFVGIGVLGGFTTFSTFALETVRLGRTHHAGAMALYIAASLVGGLSAAILGARLAALWPRLSARRDRRAA